MKAARDQWRQWSDRFAALSLRERGIAAVTLIVGGGFMVYSLTIEPFQARAQAIQEEARRTAPHQAGDPLRIPRPRTPVD